MTRVFVFGANGFIGNALATALRRNGHTVYGLARTTSKAQQLSQAEIIPIIGEISDPSTWLPTIESSVDVVVDASSSFGGLSEGLLKVIKSSTRCKEPGKRHGARLGFVYISGTWVHGSSSERVDSVEVVGEGAKNQPPDLVGWRVGMEKTILESRDVLDVVILRPSALFGGSGSLVGIWWRPIVEAAKRGETGSVEVHGAPGLWISLVHKDDLAQAVVLGVEKIEQLQAYSYPIFDVVSCVEQLGSIVDTAVKNSKFKGEIKYREPRDPFEKAMLTEAVIDVQRTRKVLGWEPKQWSVAHYGDVYVNAFSANLE